MAGSVADGPAEDATVVIVVPEPCLVVLVGAAGAGKSTLARRWFAPEEVLSSDDLRAVVSGDPGNQAASAAAFGILYRRLGARMRAGRTTVLDATNVIRRARTPLLRRASAVGIPAVAIVLDLPRDVVQARNAARHSRVVPADVVDRQLGELRQTLGRRQLADEGFAAVHVIRSARILEILRVGRAHAPESRPEPRAT